MAFMQSCTLLTTSSVRDSLGICFPASLLVTSFPSTPAETDRREGVSVCMAASHVLQRSYLRLQSSCRSSAAPVLSDPSVP